MLFAALETCKGVKPFKSVKSFHPEMLTCRAPLTRRTLARTRPRGLYLERRVQATRDSMSCHPYITSLGNQRRLCIVCRELLFIFYWQRADQYVLSYPLYSMYTPSVSQPVVFFRDSGITLHILRLRPHLSRCKPSPNHHVPDASSST
jgi:hypothetical protein